MPQINGNAEYAYATEFGINFFFLFFLQIFCFLIEPVYARWAFPCKTLSFYNYFFFEITI